MEQIIRCLKDYQEINNIYAPETTGFYAFYTIANNIFNNLGIAFCSYSSIDVNLEDIEKEIIKEFGYPVFNIEYVKESKYKKAILDARKNCRDLV